MRTFYSLLVLAIVGLAVAYPAEHQSQQQTAGPAVDVVQLVPVEESDAPVPEALETEGQRSKRHLGFGGVGIGVGVGFVGGGGFGGYPGGYGYGGGFYPGYGYGGFPGGYGYGGYRRYGYRYGGYGYGGGFGSPYYF
uniref:Uncharacterized protein n=1 Tax=Anopheles funestus TaxID=62324 RepID=A0A182RGN4_ANOFN